MRLTRNLLIHMLCNIKVVLSFNFSTVTILGLLPVRYFGIFKNMCDISSPVIDGKLPNTLQLFPVLEGIFYGGGGTKDYANILFFLHHDDI